MLPRYIAGFCLYIRCEGARFPTLERIRSMNAPAPVARRVVVVVETADAYEKLAPPLLNRFEKQVSKSLFAYRWGGKVSS